MYKSAHFKFLGDRDYNVIHSETLDPNTYNQLELHHMHFYHGDQVQVSVTVTNGAGSSTESSSDGFTVDLTEPNVYSLVDGYGTEEDLKYTVC